MLDVWGLPWGSSTPGALQVEGPTGVLTAREQDTRATSLCNVVGGFGIREALSVGRAKHPCTIRTPGIVVPRERRRKRDSRVVG